MDERKIEKEKAKKREIGVERERERARERERERKRERVAFGFCFCFVLFRGFILFVNWLRVVVWCCSFLCLFVCLFAKYALRVPPGGNQVDGLPPAASCCPQPPPDWTRGRLSYRRLRIKIRHAKCSIPSVGMTIAAPSLLLTGPAVDSLIVGFVSRFDMESVVFPL